MTNLSAGSIALINAGQSDQVHEPVLQLLSIKKIPATSPSGMDRWRMICSDGETYAQAMLSTSLNQYAESGQLDRFSVFRLDNHASNQVQNKKIIVVLAVTPLEHLSEKIGNPVSIESKPNVDSAPAAPAPEAAPAPAPVATRKPQPKSSNRSGGASNTALYPIDSLSPYQNKWTIKARVTNKSDIRTWSNARGDGKLFSVTFMDASGEIRATAFNEAVDRFYNLLEEQKVYYVSKGRVSVAKKNFNPTKNDYEIAFGNDTEVELCTDADDLPVPTFDFVPLGDLANVEAQSTCDVLGVVKEVGDMGTITSKATQREIKKRELTLVDASKASIRLTLWGKQAENFDTPENSVVAFKAVRVGEFNGRTLSMVASSSMMIEPDIPDAHTLRGWFEKEGSSANYQAFSSSGGAGGAGASFKPNEFRTIEQVKNEGLGQNEAVYFNIRATVMYIKDNSLSYPACPTPRCNKKVVMEGNDVWRCEKCDTTYPSPEYRYVLSLSVGDHTGQCWLSGFNDAGNTLIGHEAGQMEHLRDHDEAAFKKILLSSTAKMWNFACRAKSDTYNDQVKLKYQIMAVKPVDFVEAGKRLVEEIQRYGIGP